VNAFERLNARVALVTTSPAMKPVVPPAPICNTPPLIVVPPVNELDPESVSVPAPSLVSVPPLLLSGEANVTFCPLVSMP